MHLFSIYWLFSTVQIGRCAFFGVFYLPLQWYRARIEGRDGQKVSVLYIDYGTRETLPIERMRRCPAVLGSAAVPPQALPCALSGTVSLYLSIVALMFGFLVFTPLIILFVPAS